MNRTIACLLLAACAPLASFGCAAPDGEMLQGTDSEESDEDIGTAGGALASSDPPTGNNHFDALCHWAPDVQAAYRLMGSTQVDRGNGYLPNLTISPGCRHDALQNVIQCALGQEQTLKDPVTGVKYQGHWGLATSWTESALTTSQRRWVTACMAQRLNAFGLPVSILLEGDTPPIHQHSVLDSEYPWDESTVWGDLFSSTAPLGSPNSPPYQLYACSDDDLASSCSGGGTPDNLLDYRVCDTSPFCGLVAMGPCSTESVCKTDASGYPVCSSPEGDFVETVHVQLAGALCVPPP